MKTTRICIYPKDVQLITGKSYSAACELLKKIKESLGKEPHQFITLEEFSRHVGLPVNEVKNNMRA